MANIKSQKKRIITNEKARMRNRAVRSELKLLYVSYAKLLKLRMVQKLTLLLLMLAACLTVQPPRVLFTSARLLTARVAL